MHKPRHFVPCRAVTNTPEDRVLRIIEKIGLARPADLEARGIPRAQLYRLVRRGLVVRATRGVYVAARHAPTAEHALAQVAKRVPAGVICLLTALRFHGLTTQARCTSTGFVSALIR